MNGNSPVKPKQSQEVNLLVWQAFLNMPVIINRTEWESYIGLCVQE